MIEFNKSTMRFPTKDRKPYIGTKVRITGTSKNGLLGIVTRKEPEWKWSENSIAVEIGGVIFKFYYHNLIEILA